MNFHTAHPHPGFFGRPGRNLAMAAAAIVVCAGVIGGVVAWDALDDGGTAAAPSVEPEIAPAGNEISTSIRSEAAPADIVYYLVATEADAALLLDTLAAGEAIDGGLGITSPRAYVKVAGDDTESFLARVGEEQAISWALGGSRVDLVDLRIQT